MKKKALVLAVAVSFVLSFISVLNAADTLSGSVSVSGVGKYLWRGQTVSSGAALQPGFSLNVNKFTFSYWGSDHAYVGSGDSKYNESDYTVGFADTVPGLSLLTMKSGFTMYTFPYTPVPKNNSQELYGGLTANTMLSPYLSYYYDPVLGKGAYAEAGITQSFAFGDFGVSGLLTGGYNFGQWGYSSSFTDLGLTVGVSYTIAGIFINPSVFWQIPLDSQYVNTAIGQLSVTYNFGS